MSSSQATKNKLRMRRPGARVELPGFCPLYHRAVELIGRRWTGVIVRALCGGSRRFNELLVTIPGLSDRLLTERLRELEREGVVRREVAPGPPVRVAYALTDRGAQLPRGRACPRRRAPTACPPHRRGCPGDPNRSGNPNRPLPS